jgi:hypothetical protein
METTDKCIENSGTVISHTQRKRPIVNVTINEKKLVREFKYLRFTGTDRLSLKFYS